jgi:hypothetical protein
VSVRYRRLGDAIWNQGMPLTRVPAGGKGKKAWANKHSGSIFDVAANTTYEIELTLTDPDGGSATWTGTGTTRAVPVPMPGAPVKPVTPATFASVVASAVPGDILDLSAGTYSGFTFSRDGLAGQSIVIRSTAGAVINGNVTLNDRKFVHLDGLTINGTVFFKNSDGVAVMRCTINTTEHGITSGYLRSQNSYIADNVVTGATVWAESSLGVNGNNIGEGILVIGPGHVIMNNHVSGFRDDISFGESGDAVDQYSIDVLNNDLLNAADDGIEADSCMHNCRIMRNRFTNTFMGVSAAPVLGGPEYSIRNVMYNVILEPFKLHNNTTGNVILHNTIVKNGNAFHVADSTNITYTYIRNNLFIGGPGGTYNGYNNGTGRVVNIPNWTSTDSANYDAYGSTAGTFEGKFGTTFFYSLAEMHSLTTETNAVQIDLGVFLNSVAYPSNPFPAWPVPDLRLRSGSATENVGLVIPNVNDGYGGSAPDTGAYEVGAALPIYGPRP